MQAQHRKQPVATLLALVLLGLHAGEAVLRGLPLASDDDDHHVQTAVVAVWGREGTEAAAVRCTGVFIAPEVVLTAAACVLADAPKTLLQQAACANGFTAGCPTLLPEALQILDASELPESREQIAEVLAFEFRYSSPSAMPRVCSGSAICGEGWDIAALRVRQLCPRQRCVPPLPLSLGSLRAGETLRLVGAGIDPCVAKPRIHRPLCSLTEGGPPPRLLMGRSDGLEISSRQGRCIIG